MGNYWLSFLKEGSGVGSIGSLFILCYKKVLSWPLTGLCVSPLCLVLILWISIPAIWCLCATVGWSTKMIKGLFFWEWWTAHHVELRIIIKIGFYSVLFALALTLDGALLDLGLKPARDYILSRDYDITNQIIDRLSMYLHNTTALVLPVRYLGEMLHEKSQTLGMKCSEVINLSICAII